MKAILHQLVIGVATLVIAACSGSGPGTSVGPSASPGTDAGSVGKTLSDTAGNIYEGDYTVGDGQLRHLILQLTFADQVVSGYVLGTDGVIAGTVSGSWQQSSDSEDITGTLSIQSDTSAEDLELTFSGNPSGISGALSSITNSPEGSSSSTGSFSLTATGASQQQ